MNSVQNTKIPQNRLREFRITPRISQWELALHSGVKQSRISLIENCLVLPNTREKEKLAEILNHSIEEIFPNNARQQRDNDTKEST